MVENEEVLERFYNRLTEQEKKDISGILFIHGTYDLTKLIQEGHSIHMHIKTLLSEYETIDDKAIDEANEEFNETWGIESKPMTLDEIKIDILNGIITNIAHIFDTYSNIIHYGVLLREDEIVSDGLDVIQAYSVFGKKYADKLKRKQVKQSQVLNQK